MDQAGLKLVDSPACLPSARTKGVSHHPRLFPLSSITNSVPNLVQACFPFSYVVEDDFEFLTILVPSLLVLGSQVCATTPSFVGDPSKIF